MTITARYEFAPLRYHNSIAGECLNIGMLMYSPDTGDILLNIPENTERLEAAFEGFDKETFEMLRQGLFSSVFQLVGFHGRSLQGIINHILPPNDNSYRFGEVGGTFIDLDKCREEMERLRKLYLPREKEF